MSSVVALSLWAEEHASSTASSTACQCAGKPICGSLWRTIAYRFPHSLGLQPSNAAYWWEINPAAQRCIAQLTTGSTHSFAGAAVAQPNPATGARTPFRLRVDQQRRRPHCDRDQCLVADALIGATVEPHLPVITGAMLAGVLEQPPSLEGQRSGWHGGRKRATKRERTSFVVISGIASTTRRTTRAHRPMLLHFSAQSAL
jgi:hypothetical protein